MSIKTILVCMTTEANAETLMTAAVVMARKHNAHLIGMHTMEALLVYPGIAMHVSDPLFEQFNKGQRQTAVAIEKIYRAKVRSEAFPNEWRLLKTESTTAADRLIESARAADLVVVAQENLETDRYDQSHLQDRMIRESGRPVLVVPIDYAGEDFGHTVLVGWSATREATRAAHDVLGVIDQDGEANILRINAKNADELADFASNELAALYDRHGIHTNVIHRRTNGHSISELLNKEAFECGADMIVTGAFGHSRVYDFVIGAATRELLHGAKFPVLYSK